MQELLHGLLRDAPVFLILGGLIGFLFLVVHLQEKDRERLSQAWDEVMDGEFDYVVYGEYDYVRRVGSMSKHDKTFIMKTTAVHFADGRACVAKGRLDMPFSKGERIRISRNGLGGYKVEKA